MPDQAENTRAGLLDSCRIAFVLSKTLSSAMITELSQIVKQHGAEVLEPDRKGKLRVLEATHIVSNTIDFSQYKDAEEYMVPVVTTAWIKNTVARGKVAQVRPYSPDPRMIFSNVILTCADIPDTDKEIIHGATMAQGGMYTKDMTKQTTHVCALSMDHPKCIEVEKRKLKCKIVLPHWFDDCFRLGKRIDEGPYLLPDPEILRVGSEVDVRIPSSQHLEGATSALPDMMVEGKRTATVFQQRRVMLSPDLGINARARKILVDIIEGGDGRVVESVDACDIFVCQFRDGDDYIKAAQSAKEVGNLAWLYYLIIHNEWTSPLRRLLHYPIPRNGIPGFENMKITISNYGGDARTYLENLIKAAGAEYTKSMKADNTHLITARMHSEKCDAARDWNIEILNHLWIEESYAKCQIQPLTLPKYHHFPARTNLGEVIGQTMHEERVLRAIFYPGGEKPPATNKKRKSMSDAKETTRKTAPEFSVMNESSPSRAKNTNKGAVRNQPPVGDFVTPAKGRHVRSGKENDTPSVVSTGSRSAKAQAVSKLQGLAGDIALYEKEKKRTGKDGPWGGKRAADQIDKDRSTRGSSLAEEAEVEEAPASNKRPSKKQKLSSLPQVEMRVCLTGYKGWVGDLAKEEADRKKLRAMGIQIVQDNQPCDYLAAPHMVRTQKFLRGLAKGVEVLDSNFIDECLKAGELLDPNDFILKDRENEKKFGLKLSTSVARARANRGRLLHGIPIYCTADIRNGPEAYQAIAEANGAIFKIYRARSGTTIRPTTAEEDGGAPPDPVYLLSATEPTEKALWSKFEKMAQDGHMEPRIVTPDWLLDVAMRQELTFDKRFLTKNWYRNG